MDGLAATLEDIGATIQELTTLLSEAYHPFLVRLGHRLYRFKYRLRGEEYEPYD